MAAESQIEWTDATWTPIRARFETLAGDEPGKPRLGWHCEHVSEGCRHCYAEAINRRLGTLLSFKPGHRQDVDIILDEKMLMLPIRWRRPRRIFVCSMTDLFADFVPDEMIDAVFAVMSLAKQHTFQVLTKRPERMRRYMEDRARKLARFMIDEYLIKGSMARAKAPLPGRPIAVDWPVTSVGDIDMPDDVTMRHWPLPNVWMGTSVEAAYQWQRVRELLKVPAAVRFISAEPLLGHLGILVNWIAPRDIDGMPMIHWVIAGGESGSNARPMHPDWARHLRDACAAAAVPFLFKQWGAWAPLENALPVEVGSPTIAAWPDGKVEQRLATGTRLDAAAKGVAMYRTTKAAAGRLLDGVQHDGMPQ